MSFQLPEFGFQILNVAVSSLDVQLVESCVNRNSYYLPSGLEMSFQSHMEILSNGLLNCVPVADSLDQAVAHCVV